MVQFLRFSGGQGAVIALGNLFFRYRNALFPAMILLGLLLARPRYPFGDPGLDAIMDLAGLLICMLGQGLRILTIGYEYIRRGGKHGRVYANDLVTGGVFAHCRNPLYLGNIMLFAGMVVMINDPWLYALGVPVVLFVYSAIVAAEESFLQEKFGAAYQSYCARVSRWWPNWQGFRQSVSEMRFNWRRVLLKEYNTTFLWLASLVLIQIWQHAVHSPGPTQEIIGGGDALLFMPLVAGYCTIWLLKRCGILRL